MHQGTWGVALHRDTAEADSVICCVAGTSGVAIHRYTAEETSVWWLCVWEHGELPCTETRVN